MLRDRARSIARNAALCYGAICGSVYGQEISTPASQGQRSEIKRPLISWLSGGEFSVAALLGQQPNTFDTMRINYHGKGALAVDVLGIPVKVELEGMTATPVMGRRTRFNVKLDTERLAQRDQEIKERELSKLNSRSDSLLEIRNTLERNRIALERRKALIMQGPNSSLNNLSDSASQIVSQRGRPTGAFVQNIDTINVRNLDDSYISDSLSNFSCIKTEYQAVWDGMDVSRIDSSVTELQQRIDAIDEQRRMVDQERSRASLVGAVRGPTAFLTRGAVNLQNLQVGECHGMDSQYLLTGITFQGAATRLGGRGWTLDMAHGRSYDDSWRDRSIQQDRASRLQRIFVMDEQDEHNPRKLSAFMLRTSLRNEWMIGIGALAASRYDQPFGPPLPESIQPPKQLNRVVELEVARTIGAHHKFQINAARSFDRLIEGSAPSASWSDQAMGSSKGVEHLATKAQWTSNIAAYRCDIDASVSLVGRSFNSLGAAFLRSGASSAQLGFTKAWGRSIRMRLIGSHEQRASGSRPDMTLDRLRASLQWRLGKGSSMTITYLPFRTRTTGGDGVVVQQAQNMVTCALKHDRRHEKGRLRADIGVSRYGFMMSGSGSVTYTLATGVGFIRKNDSQLSVRANLLLPSDSSALVDLTLDAAFAIQKTWRCSAQLTLPIVPSRQLAGTAGVQRKLSQRMTLSLMGSRVVRDDLFFNDRVSIPSFSIYTCEVRLSYAW